MAKLGAHVSIAGGYEQALKKISIMGGNCLQIFSTSPRGWNFAAITSSEENSFKAQNKTLKINPIYFHASYLINLADEGRIGHLSKLSLIAEMNIAKKIGVKGSIIHLGSYKKEKTSIKYSILIKNIKEILDKTTECLFIIENAGNHKIGQSPEEITEIVEDVDNNRVRICFDTCHLHATGFDIRTEQKLSDFLKKLNGMIGLNKLELFHVNDSRDDFGSFRDRHDNIGQGKIGLESFRVLLNHPQTKRLPFIIEVPGFDGNGPDKKNLDILKDLIE